jgi:hypothetical protein
MGAPSNRDLLAACLWAAVMVIAIAVGGGVFPRTVLGAPMALLISGHAVLRAIGLRTTSLAEHLAYAVGASVATGIAGGLALNALGLLSPLGWAFWFLAVAVGASLVAAGRRDVPDLPPWPGPAGVRLWHGAAFAVAMLVATGAYALAIRDEASQQQFKYTEFWMLPSASGERIAVGVRSAEAKPERFDLEVTLDGRPFAVFRSLTVAPGETWAREIPVPLRAIPQKAAAKLYRPEDNRLYRSVSALLPSN